MQAKRLKMTLAGIAVATGSIVLAAGSASARVPVGGISTRPSAGSAVGPAFTGPTADLATVANNISYRAKSVTTVISAPAGLALEEPVNISVGYVGKYGGTRLTQDYVASTGNRFLYNFPAGDSTGYVADIWVTLSEANPDGGVYTLAFE